jgi:membrane protein DedA with SNARE-associated domain
MMHLADFDFSWVAKFLSLLVLPFAYEDLAIILGGYIVVNQLMPVGLVLASVYGGMVASDFALYGIGAGARRLPWLSRWAVDDRVLNFGEGLKRNLFELVAFCRVVPGVDFIAFTACGWTRVPFSRFSIATLVVSALYLPLMLYLVTIFGDALDDHAGLWAWPLILCVLVVAGFVRHRVFTLDGGEGRGDKSTSDGPLRQRNRDASSALPPSDAPRLARLMAFPRAVKWLSLR